MIHAIIGAVGGESSPLSVNSTFAELLRLVQVGIFAGVLYLIQKVKNTANGSDETHSTILTELKDVNVRLDGIITEQEKVREELKGKVNI